jgi:hypothetical protein
MYGVTGIMTLWIANFTIICFGIKVPGRDMGPLGLRVAVLANSPDPLPDTIRFE